MLLHRELKAVLAAADSDGSTQQLAMEIMGYPHDHRDPVIRRLRRIFICGLEDGRPVQPLARELGILLEAMLRDRIINIEIRGGGTVGNA